MHNKQYFNISQFRSETWYRLKNNAVELKRASKSKELNADARDCFEALHLIEQYWAYPGIERVRELETLYHDHEFAALSNALIDTVRALISGSYRNDVEDFSLEKRREHQEDLTFETKQQHYFELLIVDDADEVEQQEIIEKLAKAADGSDKFNYKVLFARSFQDALLAIAFNPNIQSTIIRFGIPFVSKNKIDSVSSFASKLLEKGDAVRKSRDRGYELAAILREFRPEVDQFYVTDISVGDISDGTLKCFNRIFYRSEDMQEMHLSVLQAIKERYDTPFFSALTEYSKKPMGVFHAMPISRGNSVFKSRWIRDFGEFYGRNIFLAETSSTTGGLDSLLQPTGPLKKARELASTAYGSQRTFFVTNGTSTANKIVVQAMVKPEDLVLIDRDCHKSHHYGLVLGGAYPVYLDSYPVPEYSMYGAVPLTHIKQKIQRLKKAGREDKIKMLLLTNCTFDGLVYNVERVMEEVLAIKPDMVFLWDEAWFAFAGFTHTYKQRTAMFVANKLYRKYNSEVYRLAYEEALEKGEADNMPDPDLVKIRVYSTQSTHKTLSSMRQGSMIHIFDEEFKRCSEDPFHEAYMTHTSTSPNYQILGSLDVGRRQVQFEGYEMVEKSIELAMVLRSKVVSHPKLKKYFDVLTVHNFIPKKHRKSGITEYFHQESGWSSMEEAWANDEFVLDPTKINLYIGRTGVDGDTFKNKYLMDRFGIQINKTSRNSVLFMTNIGTKRSSVAYLISVLLEIADLLEDKIHAMNDAELKIHEAKVYSLTEEVPPLPDFSNFHASFQAVPGVPGGDLRRAYFLAYNETNCEYIRLDKCHGLMDEGRQLVSTAFVIPYPPGFPILVPGQVLSPEILEFFQKLDVKEIHGYRPELGLRVFTPEALKAANTNGKEKNSANGQQASKKTTKTT